MPADRLDTLYDAYMDGELSAENESELMDLLRDPENRRTWRTLSALEGGIQEVLSEGIVPVAHEAGVGRWLPAGGWGWRWMAAAATLLVGLGVYWLAGSRSEWRAEIVETMGQVRVTSGEGFVVAEKGMRIRPGAAVETLGGGRVALLCNDMTFVALNERTTFRMGAVPEGKRLWVARGDVYVGAANQPIGRPMVINPGEHDEVRVAGTTLELARWDGTSTIRVGDGVVEFGQGEGRLKIQAGEFSSVVPGGRPTAAQTMEEGMLASWLTGMGDVADRYLAGVKALEDSFEGDEISDTWVEMDPPRCAVVSRGDLRLHASAKDMKQGVTCRVTSRPVPLNGRPIDITLSRDRHARPPDDSESAIRYLVLDEDGKAVCTVWLKCFLSPRTGRVHNRYGVAMGSRFQHEFQTGFVPYTFRILIAPDGRVTLGWNREEITQDACLADVETGRRIRAVSVAVESYAAPSQECKAAVHDVTIRRINHLPESVRGMVRRN